MDVNVGCCLFVMLKQYREVRENESGLLGSLTQEGAELF